MSKYGTKFVESEALLAVSEGDEPQAADIIADMLPGERRALAVAAYRLYELATGSSPHHPNMRNPPDSEE